MEVAAQPEVVQSFVEDLIKVEQAIVQREDMQYLYHDGNDYVFMNTKTYDQTNVPEVALGEAKDYLIEQMVAQIAFYNGEIIGVEIPASVELTIAMTEPGLQGDRSSGGTKPATLETGKVIQVPLFVNIGDKHGNLVHCFERECSIQRRHQ